MTEADWLSCTCSGPMLEFLRGKISDRKLRLFGAACCRRIWHLIVHPISREAVEIGERFADGLASDDERHLKYGEADDIRCLLGGVGTGNLEQDAEEEYGGILAAAGISPDVAAPAADEAWGCAEPEPEETGIGASALEAVANLSATDVGVERAAQAAILRDLVGNAFRPVLVDLARCGDAVAALARAAYESRQMPTGTLDPTRLAALADALEKAGCRDEHVLTHLREPGSNHVRGCWVVDLVLDKV